MENIKSFLATVDVVYPITSDLLPYEKGENADFVPIYNGNTDISDKDARFYGAIKFIYPGMTTEYYAYPFDKNNFTMPIVGETVIIMEIDSNVFWLPYTITPYSSYRRDYVSFKDSKAVDGTKAKGGGNAQSQRETAQTGGQNANKKKDDKNQYKVNEKIKFLKPKEGDTILQGRVGNTIRFSEFHLTEDGKTSSPSIFIRNKQNPELDSKKIGELVEEDINKDGTSIYITSNKVKIPFKEEVKKEKKGFKEYPNSKDLNGDQLFVNSDRIVLSAKAKEFIIFGKGNTGVITDGNYSVDAAKDIYLHTDKNVTIHSSGANQIFFNSENGKIFLGKNKGEGGAGADVQKMVLGGELVKIMGELIDEITKQVYATPCGPTSNGPVNIPAFKAIKGKLNTLLSAKNYLSKS
ncbi:MAG: hypothetical protein ACO21H_07430 [Sediminibacterium sp.]